MTNDDHYPAPEVGRGSFGAGGIEVVIRFGNPVIALKCDGYDVAYLDDKFLRNALDELERLGSMAGLRSISI